MRITITEKSSILQIIHLFERAGYEARIVGGMIRDSLLGYSVTDMDIATTAKPDMTLDIITKSFPNCNIIAIDRKYFKITIRIDGQVFDITSLREDVTSYGGKTTIHHTMSWPLDVKRRDFTINALYADKDGKVYDFASGLPDIRRRILRFIGNPVVRVQTDQLRILRYYRLQAQLRFTRFDKSALDACSKGIQHVEKISPQRIYKEIKALFSIPFDIRSTLYSMQKNNILAAVFPFSIIGLQDLLSKMPITSDPWIKILFLTEGKYNHVKNILAAWNVPKREKNAIKACMSVYNDRLFCPQRAFQYAYFYGVEATLRASSLKRAQGCTNYDLVTILLKKWRRPIFPLCGYQLKKMGMQEGPHLGRLLRITEKWWSKNDFKPKLDDCLSFARQRRDALR